MTDKMAYLLHSRLPAFTRRVNQAQDVLRQAAMLGPLAISISWGKDSCALADLAVRTLGPLDLVHIASPHELPGWEPIQDYFQGLGCRLHSLPALPLPEYLEWLQSVQLSHMRTEAQQQNAVQHLKKDKGEDWALSNGFTCTALGLRLDESKGKRGKLIQTRGLLYRRNSGLWHCNPLGYWSHRDVWAYLFSRNVPYHPLYDHETHGFNREELRNSGWLTTDGISRTGRMPWLRQHYRDQYNALIEHFPEVQQFG